MRGHYSFTRESYISTLAKGSTKVVCKQTGAEIYLYERQGVPYALVFSGKRNKADINARYKNAEDRVSHIERYIAGLVAAKAAKKAQRAARNAGHGDITIGAIFYTSWGYDQTNVEFFEVVGLKGKCTVILREIAQESQETGPMAGRCTGRPGVYIGDLFNRRISGGAVRIDDVRSGSVWDGQPKYWSSYA